jgi:glycosyltransferase involved in cell wall biosynthesis
MPPAPAKPLNILHVLRAPVGGLFRHVADLASGQASRGHRVGIIADASTGGPQAESVLARLSASMTLGVTRVPMSRAIGTPDIAAAAHVARRLEATAADVVHGHGAKGGAYARLAGRTGAVRAYTPHGGSLHYRWGTPAGVLYLGLERMLTDRTDLFLFESSYSRQIFCHKLGDPGPRAHVVHNGVATSEFASVERVSAPVDLIFVGELRELKGIDVLIDAMALLAHDGRAVTAIIVGEGPDRAKLEAMARTKLSTGAVRFAGAMPARAAFALGRVLVIPSRAESLPYIVLEAAAAAMPMVATRVGGIPEIFGPQADQLVPPDDAGALALAIRRALDGGEDREAAALCLQQRLRTHFSVDAMTDAILAAYADACARSRAGNPAMRG